MILGRRDRNLLIRASQALTEQRELIETQQQLLHASVKQIAVWQDLTLLTTREARNLAVAVRVSAEMPEVDIRGDLDMLIRELDDQVARLEEQIVS